VLEPIACDPHTSSTPAVCAQLWRDWEYELTRMFSPASLAGNAPPVDAGAPRADAGDEGRSDGSKRVAARELGARGGCDVALGRGGRGVGAWVLIGLALCAVEGGRMLNRRGRMRATCGHTRREA